MQLLAESLPGLFAILAMMLVLWVVSVLLRNASIVDLFWGPAIAVGGTAYYLGADAPDARAQLVLVLVWLWALRLGVYLTLRNFGKPEDRRYTAMRERHDPGFWYKSLYLVFGLQAVLAWIVGAPLFGAIRADAPLGWLDYLGVLVFAVGLVWESVADWQLARFLRTRDNSGAVMDKGLWRYSRHPNYFGEFCLWWGIWLIAVSAGAWWTLFGPLLLSFFLLRVSGVSLLEQDITERRPAYQDYIRRTSTFFPWPPSSD